MSTRQDLIHVSGGDLLMGSQGFYPEEAPVMRVLIDDLWIRSTLVTNAEFSTFVTSTGYVTTAEQEDRQGSVVFVGTPGPVPLNDWRQWWAWQPGANWRHPQGPDSSVEGRASHPVVHVSLHDARAYATWAGLEIPHEPEWEWCARGGLESATYTWGEEPNKGDELFANTWQGDFPFDNRGA
ncbi:MAG: formylglycine-generating enzyme family protein, partial [Actinomycetia bacterium]|nr:formylglycine-generating enzyme family protein [Actinomycetes bacterium]